MPPTLSSLYFKVPAIDTIELALLSLPREESSSQSSASGSMAGTWASVITKLRKNVRETMREQRSPIVPSVLIQAGDGAGVLL
jgi:hypothetical protein